MELPPRARRIPRTTRKPSTCMGTTSACAENTRAPGLYPHQARNYLRVRGEYQIRKNVRCPASELPPRARRIRSPSGSRASSMGTTSACAENTRKGLLLRLRDGNYLRVRGEYGMVAALCSTTRELPPRARRIHLINNQLRLFHGTTSACAENTSHQQSAPALPRNYLRVRGEYFSPRVWSSQRAELPPRARRIPPVGVAVPISLGTTSACAENTRRQACMR